MIKISNSFHFRADHETSSKRCSTFKRRKAIKWSPKLAANAPGCSANGAADMATQSLLEPLLAVPANKDMLVHQVHLVMMEPMEKMENMAKLEQPELRALFCPPPNLQPCA